MTPSPTSIEEEALEWLIRQKDAETADWPGFESWMAGDPAREAAYWQLATADARLGETLAAEPRAAETPSANVVPIRPPARRFRITAPLGALAASVLVAFLGFGIASWSPWFHPAQTYAIETAAGTTRNLTLPDGTGIALNGATRLLLDRNAPRTVRIERGEARFTVVHDAARPFAVQIGDATIRDVGTSFDVIRDAAGVRVAVAEGMVRFEGEGLTRDLRAGDTIVLPTGDGPARIGHMDPADVAAWEQRRLVYDGAPLAIVATDLSRITGEPITVAPSLADRRFSGGIQLDAKDAIALQRAAAIMDVKAIRKDGGWMLEAGTPPAR
jgi:transmembrane sensor